MKRLRRLARDTIGNAGLGETAGGTWHEDAAGDELFELRHRRAVEEGASRDPEQGGRLQGLCGRVLGRVPVDGRQELLPAPKSLGDLRQIGVIHEVGPLDHEQEILKLLGAVRGYDEVAVPCWFDGWNLDRPSGPRDAVAIRQTMRTRRGT